MLLHTYIHTPHHSSSLGKDKVWKCGSVEVELFSYLSLDLRLKYISKFANMCLEHILNRSEYFIRVHVDTHTETRVVISYFPSGRGCVRGCEIKVVWDRCGAQHSCALRHTYLRNVDNGGVFKSTTA